MKRFSGTVIPAPYKIARQSENMYMAWWNDGNFARVTVDNGHVSCRDIDGVCVTMPESLRSAYAHCAAFNVQTRLK